jgi:hypothetical protein
VADQRPRTPTLQDATTISGVRRAAASLLLLLLLLGGCGSIRLLEVKACDTLYFGTARTSGPAVTDAEWRTFVDEVITPRFPGFTELSAVGHWQAEREASHVVVIIHGKNDGDGKLGEIVREYKKRFQQQSVYWTRGEVVADEL